MSILLREFKKYNISLFPDLDSGRVDKWLTKEETNEALDKMIYYFDNTCLSQNKSNRFF